MIDWRAIAKQMAGIHAKKQGEAAWPPLLMVKALLLQSWYGLSDPGLEKQLARGLMFRRFIKLGLSEGVPDHSTTWRFRNTLTQQGLLDTLLSGANQQLSAKGLYIKAGEVSIVDATVIEAKQSRPRKGKDGENTQGSEAGYNVKAVGYTPGNGHDPQSLEKLLTGGEEQAYASKEHDKLLAKCNTGNRILHKAKRNQPLSVPQTQQNRQWPSIRSTVGRVFGVPKQHYRLAKTRCLGLKRNQARFMLAAMAYNIKRGVAVQAEMLTFAG